MFMASTSSSVENTKNVLGEEQQKKDKSGKLKVKGQSGPPFSLKKWNAVAMWQWDVECDTCAICRVQVMGESQVIDKWAIVSSF